jgi:hypothetical protein
MNKAKSPATATVAGQEINAEPTGSTAINIPHPPVINNYPLSEQQGRPQVGHHPRQRIELTENNNMKPQAKKTLGNISLRINPDFGKIGAIESYRDAS